jgi:hypothetical protein
MLNMSKRIGAFSRLCYGHALFKQKIVSITQEMECSRRLRKKRLAVGGSPKKKTPPNADDVPRWLAK